MSIENLESWKLMTNEELDRIESFVQEKIVPLCITDNHKMLLSDAMTKLGQKTRDRTLEINQNPIPLVNFVYRYDDTQDWALTKELLLLFPEDTKRAHWEHLEYIVNGTELAKPLKNVRKKKGRRQPLRRAEPLEEGDDPGI